MADGGLAYKPWEQQYYSASGDQVPLTASPYDFPGWGVPESVYRDLGYEGPLYEDEGSGDMVSQRTAPALQQWLDQRGYSLGQARTGSQGSGFTAGSTFMNSLLDKDGSAVGRGWGSADDNAKALQGMALVAATAAGAYGAGAYGGAAGATEAGAGSGLAATPATNAALADSAAGTAGYGGSSAGAGAGSGLFGTGVTGKQLIDGATAVAPLLGAGSSGGGGSAGGGLGALSSASPSTQGNLGQRSARFSPQEFKAGPGPAAREGHTRGPSSAVNLNDPSAALFGYGEVPQYYSNSVSPGEGRVQLDPPVRGMAGGGQVTEVTAGSEPYAMEEPRYAPTGGSGLRVPARFDRAAPLGVDAPSGGLSEWWKAYTAGNPKAQHQALAALGGIGALAQLFNKRTRLPSAGELAAGLPRGANMTAQQNDTMQRYFGAPAARFTAPSVVRTAGRGLQNLARGGEVFSPGTHGSYVDHDGPGQEDDVSANLSGGEYVWDADTVSALGDGNNAAGAAALDAAREQIRAHKRSAPVTDIPPPALSPLDYLRKAT